MPAPVVTTSHTSALISKWRRFQKILGAIHSLMICVVFYSIVLNSKLSKASPPVPPSDCSTSFTNQKFDTKTDPVDSHNVSLLNRLEYAVLGLSDHKPLKGSELNPYLPALVPRGDLIKKIVELGKKPRARFSMVAWLVVQESLFPEEIKIEEDFFKQVGGLYKEFLSETYSHDDIFATAEKIKRGKASFVEKTKLINGLKLLSTFFSQVLAKEVNLLEAEGFLAFFSVEDQKDLGDRFTDLVSKNQDLELRASEHGLERTTVETDKTHKFISSLVQKIFGTKIIVANATVRPYLIRNGNKERILELIRMMGLPYDEFSKYEGYLNAIQDLHKSSSRNDITKRARYVVVLYDAFITNFGPIPETRSGTRTKGEMTVPQILWTTRRIHSIHHTTAIVEEQFYEFIETSDELKARTAKLEENIETFRASGMATNFQHLDEMLNAIPNERLDDPDQDFEKLEREIFRLEAELDHLREEALKTKELLEITAFEDLNSRWERLLPNHPYTIEGSDYSRVLFEPRVISHLRNKTQLGTRFLAALSKSYVGHENQNGLRRLNQIHPDFRDIKVVTHGKIRVVGKLVGDTIHFFHIHEGDRKYNKAPTQRLIEHYHPTDRVPPGS